MQIPTSGKYKINGVSIPDPSSWKPKSNPIHGEATGRTDNGVMHTEIIDLGKRTIVLSYDLLPDDQLHLITNLLRVQYYTLTYPHDLVNNGSTTIECYGTPFDADLYSGVLYNGLWRNLKIDCVER